jgi:transposase
MTNRNSAGVNAFWMLRTGEKGDLKVGPTKCGKGTTWMVLVDGAGTPLGAYLGSASPAKVRLLEATLDTVAIGQASGGRSRKLPDRLIERATHQDGHRLRRYRHRWIVERTIGWLGNFRCLTVRYEWLLETYSGFFI